MRVDTPNETHWVDTGFIVFNDRNYPSFERLLAPHRRRRPAVEHELRGHRRDGRLRVREHARRTGCSPSAHTSRRRGSTAWSPTSCASTARPGRCSRSDGDGPSLGQFLEERRYSRAFVDRLIVPQAAAVWSADPRQMWSFPARFLVEFFDNHGMLGFRDRPQWRTIVGGSHRYVEALGGAVARPPATRHAGRVGHAARRPRDGRRRGAASAERFDHVVLATHSDQALKLLADPSEREHELLGAIPYQANEAVLHTDRRLLPRRRRAWASWNYHLLDEPTGKPTVTYHMNRLQTLRAEREFCVTLNRTEAIDPEHDHPHDPLRASRLHRRRPGRAGAPRGDQRPRPHALLRRLLGLGLPRGRRGQRRARGRAARGDGPVSHSAIYEGTHPPSPLRRAPCTSSATGSRWPTSTSTSCPTLLGGRLARSRPGLVRFRRSDYLGDPRVPLDRRGARARRRAPRQRAAGPDPPAHPPAHLRALLQPGELLLLLRRGRRARSRRSSPRSRTRRGASATPTCSRAVTPSTGPPGRLRQGPARLAVHADGPALHLARARARRDAVGADREQPRRTHARSTRRSALRRRPLTRRSLARVTARHPAATLQMLALIYGHAVALKLKGVPVQPHPRAVSS